MARLDVTFPSLVAFAWLVSPRAAAEPDGPTTFPGEKLLDLQLAKHGIRQWMQSVARNCHSFAISFRADPGSLQIVSAIPARSDTVRNRALDIAPQTPPRVPR